MDGADALLFPHWRPLLGNEFSIVEKYLINNYLALLTGKHLDSLKRKEYYK